MPWPAPTVGWQPRNILDILQTMRRAGHLFLSMATNASGQSEPSSRKLVGPLWHTLVLVLIFLALTVAGASFQREARSQPGMLQQHPRVAPLYLSLIVAEWALECGSTATHRLRTAPSLPKPTTRGRRASCPSTSSEQCRAAWADV